LPDSLAGRTFFTLNVRAAPSSETLHMIGEQHRTRVHNGEYAHGQDHKGDIINESFTAASYHYRNNMPSTPATTSTNHQYHHTDSKNINGHPSSQPPSQTRIASTSSSLSFSSSDDVSDEYYDSIVGAADNDNHNGDSNCDGAGK
jgi:hypothetical protein